jgi:hypothetical protein
MILCKYKKDKDKKRYLHNTNTIMNSICLHKTEILPDDLKIIIYSFIPLEVTVLCEKKKYEENHCVIKRIIHNKNYYENYIRDMVRKDCYYVFSFLLEENYKKWFEMKKYVYKNTIYANYLHFLKDYCIENDANNCRNEMNDFLHETGLSKNLHKKNTARNIRWRNWI